MGALECAYTVFGFRPEVIAGTSVGSINGIALAQAQTPAEGLAQMRKLRGVWDSLVGPGDFYTVREWFARLTRSSSLDLGGGVHVRLVDAVMQLLFENLWQKAEKSTSLATLDPLEVRIRSPEMFDPVKLANGIPLRMLCVSLESGRLRYATGDGRFLEEDNRTPVASALVRGAALQEQQSDFTTAAVAVRDLVEAIQFETDHGERDTKWPTIGRLNLDLQRARWRAEAAFDRVAAANAALAMPVQARVDPVIGALASAAMPGIFGPYAIGAEHYVDGGVRDIVPVRAAIQLGATEVLAIVCSTQNLPRAGYAGARNFLDNLLTSLTSITLKEIVEDDLTGLGVGEVPVTVIIPSFDVHDTAVVDMGLIHISMDYGFMRAADVLSPPSAAAGRFALSDAIARLRTDTHRLSQTWTARDARPHRTLEILRLRKWLIRRLVEARVASGVALPGLATLWFQRWEQGSSTAPLQHSPWVEFATVAETTPAVEPYSYVPDEWTYEEEGDLDGLFLIRAGARFRTTREAIAAITGPEIRIALTVPAGTSQHLPAVPVAGTVVAEVAVPGLPATPGNWYVDGTRRYLLNAAGLAQLGSPPVISIPAAGLAQIPDGGTPYWIGGLAIVSTRRDPLEVWQPTPQIESTRTSTGVTLWNRSQRGPVTVTDVRITTAADTPAGKVFRVRTAMPFVVADDDTVDVDVEFDAPAPGPLTGVVQVDCDDDIAPMVRLPLATAVLPLGAHAELTFAPDSLALGSTRVGTPLFGAVSITNTGARDASLDALEIVGEAPPGQFTLAEFGVEGLLVPGQETSQSVTYIPIVAGTARATLAVDLRSATDQPGVTYRRRYHVPLSASARMATIFIADTPGDEAELAVLDFGLGPLGKAVTRSFWIRNAGDTALTVGIPQATDRDGPWLNDPASFPATLEPGGLMEVSCSFSTGFVPGLARESGLRILSDDPARPEVVLRTRIRAVGPHLIEPPEVMDLGDVASGAGALITFTSDGSESVTVSEAQLTLAKEFSLGGVPALPAQVAPGTALVLTATLIATAPGPYQDQLIVRHDGKDGRESSILLRATIS